ncbi:MAG: hypothetical protein K6T29_02150 [Peptococcaceae bacterium]|nr:hypothetical protein [Peptococcaceae bacterium]
MCFDSLYFIHPEPPLPQFNWQRHPKVDPGCFPHFFKVRFQFHALLQQGYNNFSVLPAPKTVPRNSLLYVKKYRGDIMFPQLPSTQNPGGTFPGFPFPGMTFPGMPFPNLMPQIPGFPFPGMLFPNLTSQTPVSLFPGIPFPGMIFPGMPFPNPSPQALEQPAKEK